MQKIDKYIKQYSFGIIVLNTIVIFKLFLLINKFIIESRIKVSYAVSMSTDIPKLNNIKF